MKYQPVHETGESGRDKGSDGCPGGRNGACGLSASPRCNRCSSPQGRLVILNNSEAVCGACITRMANLRVAAARIDMDRTPAIECGFLPEVAPC